MKNLSTALAIVIACLLTGSAAAVLAKEMNASSENAFGVVRATATGSEAQTDVVGSFSSRAQESPAKPAEAADTLSFSSFAEQLWLPAAPVEAVFPDPMVSSGAKAIWIFLGAQQAFLTESGTVVKTYQISSGAPDTPTPRGAFQIYKKEELRVSSQSVAYRMPNYMAFTKNSAFGLHGLPYLGQTAESSGYWTEALGHIGTPVSHGCVRFLPEEAAELYKWADRGVPVFIQA